MVRHGDDCRAEAWVHVFEKVRWRIALSTLDSGEDGEDGEDGKTVIGPQPMRKNRILSLLVLIIDDDHIFRLYVNC